MSAGEGERGAALRVAADCVTYTPRFNNPRDEAVRRMVSKEEQQAFYKRHYVVSPAVKAIIRKIPQRSDKWKNGIWVSADGLTEVEPGTPGATHMPTREGRITGSRAGLLAGLSPYHHTVDAAMMEYFYSDFKGNPDTERGNRLEPMASMVAKATLTELATPGGVVSFSEEGLVIGDPPHYAISSDGTFVINGTPTSNEVKCPRTHKDGIPADYYCQMMLCARLQNLPGSWFVVFSGQTTKIRYFPFDQVFWDQFLFPALEDAFENYILPRRVLLARGQLQWGQLYPGTVANPQKSITAYFRPGAPSSPGGAAPLTQSPLVVDLGDMPRQDLTAEEYLDLLARPL